MTNEELIKRFFIGEVRGDEESYGFYVKPSLKEVVGNFTLYSKTSQFSTATKLSKEVFIINPAGSLPLSHQKSHVVLVISIAEQMKIEFVESPYADRNNFHKYMEGKINSDLADLAQVLNCHPRDRKFMFAPKYQKLIVDIHTLLYGEIQLNLPKNRVALLDTDEVQKLWAWLITKNPDMEDRKLLRRMYTLSRLLAPKGREVGPIKFWNLPPGSTSWITFLPPLK